MSKRRVGVVGFGALGQFLVEHIHASNDLELSFVWNRTYEAVETSQIVPEACRLRDLSGFAAHTPDLIVEVAHPNITKEYGEAFLAVCDYLVGSPTAFADESVEARVRTAGREHGVYVASGAMWGAQDILKMSRLGSLARVSIAMTFHPRSLKLTPGEHMDKLQAYIAQHNPRENEAATDSLYSHPSSSHDASHTHAPHGDMQSHNNNKHLVYAGTVRPLCAIAPNNVNTMAVASLAAHSIGGFDGVHCELWADIHAHTHTVDVKVESTSTPPLCVHTVRENPAQTGAVTGKATFNSFLASMMEARGRGPGFHIC